MNLVKLLYYKKNSIISKNSKIYSFSKITNSKIDDYTYVAYNCKINNCSIGKFCSISQNVKIGLGKHPSNFISTSPLFYSLYNPLNIKIVKECHFDEFSQVSIGNDVWIGTNVTILDGIKIGDGAIIGANCVVTKDIQPYSIVGGVPAKLIKMRFSPEVIDKLLTLKWWNYPIETIKKESILELFSKEVDIKIINKLLLRFKNI